MRPDNKETELRRQSLKKISQKSKSLIIIIQNNKRESHGKH